MTTARLAALVTAAPGRPTLPVSCPFDGSLVGEVPVCTASDVQTAAAAARRAQAVWAARPPAERAGVMLRFSDLVLDHARELLDIIQLETGKSRASAFEEVADAAGTARYYGNSAPRRLRADPRQPAFPLLSRTRVQHEPLGVVGMISPWNYPLTLAVSDAVAALAAGNGVVLKPDHHAPLTALAGLDLLQRAGLPRDLFHVVTGHGAVLGPPLIAHVDQIMFTGSSDTARTIAQECGRRLIGFSAELGGKNPMLVLRDADVRAAARNAAHAAFSNSGQLCISIERLYIEDAVYDEFVAALVARVRQLRLLPGLTWQADVGCLISAAQLEKVRAHVDDAVAQGARVLAGGRARPDLGPLFWEPTLLEGVTDAMAVAREETFGPVLSLYRVRDEAEAIARANDSDLGLNAAVWSTPRHGARVAAQLQAGTVNVNDGYSPAWSSYDAPMGGWKRSGLGRRHGPEGLLKFTQSRTVTVQRLLPVQTPEGLSHEAWARLVTGALRVFRHLPGKL